MMTSLLVLVGGTASPQEAEDEPLGTVDALILEVRHFEAKADSLAIVANSLRSDLRMAVISADSVSSWARIELGARDREIEWLESRQTKWYHDQRIWFLAGAVSALLAVDWTVGG